MAKKDTGERRRSSDDNGRDAEGTRRRPELKKALDAGLLNAPEPDRPLGPWKSE